MVFTFYDLPEEIQRKIYKIHFQDVLHEIQECCEVYCLNYSRPAILFLKGNEQGWEIWPKRIVPLNHSYH